MIKGGLEQDVVILKFRPYITDVLQPLDVASFGTPKGIWKARLKKEPTNLESNIASQDRKLLNLLQQFGQKG